MEDKKCCAIIITYNIGRNLSKCFYSILNQVNQVIIVDNGSDKKTIEYLEELEVKHKVKVIYNEENLGIATALNKGIKYAKKENFEWALTMDNDSKATENMVDCMFEMYKKIGDDRVCSIFPTYIEENLNENMEKIINKRNGSYREVMKDITSGNLVKLNVFDEVGYFEEKFFIDCVDHEFCFRLIRSNKKMIKLEDVKLIHNLGNTTETNVGFKKVTTTNHSPLRKYYVTRNRMYIWKKYSDLVGEVKLDKSNFMKENLKIILFERNKVKKFKMILSGYRDYKKNKFGKFGG